MEKHNIYMFDYKESRFLMGICVLYRRDPEDLRLERRFRNLAFAQAAGHLQ